MIKSILKFSLVSSFVFLTLPAFASSNYKYETCNEKSAAIEKQIDYAKLHGNQHQVDALQIALSNVKTHCTNGDLLKEYQKEVDKKQQKVTERTEELQKAQQDNDAKKISNKKAKLKSAQSDLKAAQKALDAFNVSQAHQ